jgi:hypothetical protein
VSTRVRPVASLPGKRSNTSDPNNRLSTCSNCRLGIFKGQPYRWQGGQRMGLVHDYDCEGDTP